MAVSKPRKVAADSGRQQPLTILPWQERWVTSYIHWLNGAAAGIVASHFAPSGVQGKHHGLLATLDATGPITQAELCVMSGIDRTTMSQNIDDLEALGLVERNISPRNRRANAVDITGAGRERLQDLDRFRASAEDELLRGLTGEERTLLRDLLRTVYDHQRAQEQQPG